MKQTRQRVILLTIIFCLTAPLWVTKPAMAASVSGRFGLWSYVRDDTVDHVQVVPLLSLNVHRFGGGAWSIESTFRGYADYQNGATNGTSALRVNRALLIYRPQSSPWEVRAGQQWIAEGIGRGNVAGLWGRYNFNSTTDLKAYAGSRLPVSLSLDESIPDEGVAAGLNLNKRFGRTRVGLSYYYVGKDSDILFNGVGLDASTKPSADLTLRARLHMNLEQSNIETGQVTAYWQAMEKLLLLADVRTQTPRIFEDSFFAMFLEESKTNAARLGAQYTIYDELYATGMGYVVFTEEDMLYKTRAGLGCKKIEVGYTHWLSAGLGDMDGFYGEVRHHYKDFEGRAGFDYSRGSNSEIRPNTESQVIFGSIDWTSCKRSSLGVRVEHLKDPLRSEDWRALFSLMTTFRSKVRSGS